MQLKENCETNMASRFIREWEVKQELEFERFPPTYALGMFGLPHFRNSRAAREIY